MTEETTEITSNDRMWAALSWLPISPLWPILAIVALVMDDTKNRPFVRYNAVVSIATGIATVILTFVTLGLGALLFIVFLYWAYKAYQGEMVEIPVISSFCRDRGWV
jgi:uncharacterized membrane protein